MNLARLDLNLLVALDALLEHRSVSRAAEQIGLSQPAVSAQLARLRRHFGDELLTRVGNQYRATPLAVQLRERVRAAVTGVERVFAAEPAFDPATTTREFSLAMSDYGVAVLGTALAGRLSAEAPAARLRFAPNTPALVDRAAHALTGIDLLLMPHGFVDGLPHRDLYRDEWVFVAADGNAAVGDGLTVELLQRLPWVMSYHGPTASTPAARQMRMLGIAPTAQVVTESFMTVPALVAGTDRIALLQRRLADRLGPAAGVRVLAPPVEIAPLVEAIWWHPMYDDDPEHLYLRDLVTRTAAELDTGDRPD